MGTASGGALLAGKYELVEPAGAGGMATVWRGQMHGAAGFVRPVAVKRIRPELLMAPDFVVMFVEEARLGSQLLHSNIAQVYDFEQEDDGAYFLVMEWVEGIDLRRYVRTYAEGGQRTPWPLVTAVAVETLRGLGAAHERVDPLGQRAPVIHRDVTPQNILLGTNGLVKLTDFGLARAMDRARTTHPDIVKGKLAYLAPEVANGQPATVQSDLFSLGVVLWEGLAGRPLYHGVTDIEVLLKVRAVDVPPLTAVRDDLPPELCAAVARALAPQPADRFGSARELLRTLTRILRGVSHSTDSYALAHSVIEARCILGAPPRDIFVPPPAATPPPVPPPRRRVSHTDPVIATDRVLDSLLGRPGRKR
ncbi:MAG TPA: serine/threonine-protein kinase [Polyangia bacterium]|jgi:serine/threonine-protein kinase